MRRDKFGPRSERSQRILDQLELQLEELAAAQGEDAAKATTQTVEVKSFTRRKATRREIPDDLPRRRIVHPAATSCPCCGGTNLCKIREKFSCRSCETLEAVKKIDAIFAIERSINGSNPEERVAVRREAIAPLVDGLIGWMRVERGKLSRHDDLARAMDYMLKRIDSFTRFLGDGRNCLSNNAAEGELRGVALRRKAWRAA
jgi:hypothetical protein